MSKSINDTLKPFILVYCSKMSNSTFYLGSDIMPANKDPEQPGKWIAQFYYTDWTGERKKKKKRGFTKKSDALEWEREFLNKYTANLSMALSSLVELYMADMAHRLRESTVENKKNIISTKILPYLGDKSVNAITAADVRKWQNQLISKGYKDTYLKTVNNQLTAIFNYAIKYYNLKENPCHKAGSMGKKNADEMQFWITEEYKTFIQAVADKPQSYMAFETLYYTGMRIGELMALTVADIDIESKTIRINKTFQRIKCRDVITPPKTPKSNRVITIPQFLVDDLVGYMGHIYGLQEGDRIFPFTKHFLTHEMVRGCTKSGVKKIRLHDIRHSHASLLIELGFSPLLISERLGHENVETTLNTYAHLYPSKQTEVADKLQELK